MYVGLVLRFAQQRNTAGPVGEGPPTGLLREPRPIRDKSARVSKHLSMMLRAWCSAAAAQLRIALHLQRRQHLDGAQVKPQMRRSQRGLRFADRRNRDGERRFVDRLGRKQPVQLGLRAIRRSPRGTASAFTRIRSIEGFSLLEAKRRLRRGLSPYRLFNRANFADRPAPPAGFRLSLVPRLRDAGQGTTQRRLARLASVAKSCHARACMMKVALPPPRLSLVSVAKSKIARRHRGFMHNFVADFG